MAKGPSKEAPPQVDHAFLQELWRTKGQVFEVLNFEPFRLIFTLGLVGLLYIAPSLVSRSGSAEYRGGGSRENTTEMSYSFHFSADQVTRAPGGAVILASDILPSGLVVTAVIENPDGSYTVNAVPRTAPETAAVRAGE